MSEDRKKPHHELARQWAKAHGSVAAFVSSFIRDPHRAEDVIQNIAVSITESFDKYDPTRPFLGWALGIARHTIVDEIKKQSRDVHLFDIDVVERVAAAYLKLDGERLETKAALEHCIEKLPEKHRQVLDMRYVAGLKPKQIAKSMNSTSNAISISLFRIRAALASCVEKRLSANGGPRA